MPRNKYLDMQEGLDTSFHNVILASVYNVKNLKLKLRPKEERKYNSPWNIAVDFDVDMSFSVDEIADREDWNSWKHILTAGTARKVI